MLQSKIPAGIDRNAETLRSEAWLVCACLTLSRVWGALSLFIRTGGDKDRTGQDRAGQDRTGQDRRQVSAVLLSDSPA
jgi:hypothetical protein